MGTAGRGPRFDPWAVFLTGFSEALPEADGFGASWNAGHQGRSTSPIAVETTQPAQPATVSVRESIGETGKKADESDSSEIVGAEVPEPENLVTELSEKESEANGRANGQATSEPSRAPKRRAPAARKSAAKPPPRLKGAHVETQLRSLHLCVGFLFLHHSPTHLTLTQPATVIRSYL